MSFNWITLRGGVRFDLLDPDPQHLDIETIAHSLGMLCRYTGHVDRFFSVAQHSVLVSYLTPPEHALAGLLHDAAEAFIGDVATPLKSLLPTYKEIETGIEAALAERYGVPAVQDPAVKAADLRALYIERDHLMPAQPDRWQHEYLSDEMKRDGYPHSWLVTDSMTPTRATLQFLDRFRHLTRETR